MSESHLPLPPGPRGAWLLGSTLDFKDSPLEYAHYLQRAYGDVVRFRVGVSDWVLLAHPDDIHRTLVKEPEVFLKPAIAHKLWKPFLGDGVLTQEGEVWKRMSRMMRPAFHRSRIEQYAAIMAAYSNRLVDGWIEGEQRDIAEDMTHLTLEIVAKTLFDADVSEDAAEFGTALLELQEVILDHLYMPLPIPRWWPSRTNRRKWAAIDTIRTIVKDVIRERRASGEDRGDLLSMLLMARDEDGVGLTDTEVLDQSATLFFAGHETTANSLAWNWYLLAKHPDVTERLQAEIDAQCGDQPPTLADLRAIPYLEQVVKESMRILPSVWAFMKEPNRDVTIRGYRIPKGTQIFYSPYVLHQDPRWFPEPQRFDPDRFSPEREAQIPKGAYVPFSGGSRVCMGKSFAMMEAQIILATMLQRIHPNVPADYVPDKLAELSMHPRGGLPFNVRLRARAASGAA